MKIAEPDKLRSIKALPSLIAYLRDELDWPAESLELDELTFDWSADQLRVSDNQSRRLADGVIRQLRPLTAGQPWGIFVVEFADDTFRRGALREILRGLVANRRRDPGLPSWQQNNLLFICATRDYDQITFAHYRGEKAQKARLALFGWQRGSSYLRTLCEFNLPALRWPEDAADTPAWLKQWASAFDKEPLTREFFKRFDKALESIQDDLKKYQKLTSPEAYSRAQLMLERLIFLYFLQNRGWLNRQRHYLLDNFAAHREKPAEFSYFENFLEKLFWTLASAPGSADRFEGIPFLNGGLFDDDEFAPTPVRMKNNPPLRVRNATFAFVFEHLLEAFNFTVREDTPLNQDVAVDPEMLGKVFESIVLHAESEADYNAPDKRKATGSYYTPRIVVHFICRESLRQYLCGHLDAEWDGKLKAVFDVDASDGLDTEEIASLKASLKAADGQRLFDLLRPIKMCDPAVGSGAFPVGLLHELVNLRRIAMTVAKGYTDPARKEGSNWIHETKADIVANCLYGVDIQQQAIEICRLRLWLSLVVDYDLGLDPFAADPAQFRQAIANISQLPNLEMNFRRGDSLLDLICDVPVRIETNQQFEKDYERIRKLGQDLHKARKSERKRNLRVEILRRRLDLSERVVSGELKQMQAADSNLAADWFGGSKSDADQRRHIAAEIKSLNTALSKIAANRKTLEKVASRPMDSRFYPELRKLEGAGFSDPFNFAWRIDFADIFSSGRALSPKAPQDGRLGDPSLPPEVLPCVAAAKQGGFDLILGNPPFVTARNPEKRELYRERWKRVCSGKYLLVCPFFDLSFGLLRPGGQLGFIVSNAFAKREFGKPLIQNFFPTVDLQKIVDCSGLMFPGHGTPTCIVFGRNQKPAENSAIRIAATLPGGGDLRTTPEESPLWKALETHHDEPGYGDERITIADRTRKDMAKWPWNLESMSEETRQVQDKHQSRLIDYVEGEVGVCTMTNCDDVFPLLTDQARRQEIPVHLLRVFQEGDGIRNWTMDSDWLVLTPYDDKSEPLKEADLGKALEYLKPFKRPLEERLSFGNKTFGQLGRPWYSFERMNANKYSTPLFIAFCEIATHNHLFFWNKRRVYKQTTQTVKLPQSASATDHHLFAGLLNSSAALFWLKQVCFNKGAGEDEERDRFVFAGGKVQQLPLPDAIADALRGKRNDLTKRLKTLSQACWERGQQMPALAMKKLFEKPGEAYHDWNAALPGYVLPASECGKPFTDLASLRENLDRVISLREQLRGEMIALQEEMDWLVYAAYGLIPADHPAAGTKLPTPRFTSPSHGGDQGKKIPSLEGCPTGGVGSLLREQRPFVLWAQAVAGLVEAGPGSSPPATEIFDKAVALIRSDWPDERKTLWRARLECIRDNDHIRRIEQPVYKRRWDEQWKVGNRWQCGEIAYQAELIEAFDWWLSEKAEWWLEKKKDGGPVEIENWTMALAGDARVKLAWDVAGEALKRLDRFAPFDRYFHDLIKEQSVPADIPWAVPWEELEKKRKIPANVKRIRGKLNVPRERFRVKENGQYIWAGK